jgi:hypothetical protein
LTILVALSAARAQEATRQTPRNSMERSDFATAPAHDCAMQLRNFIQALDQLIDTSPNIYPLLRLLKQYFPVKNCNIPEAIEICKQSKYFVSADELRTYYVVVFSGKAGTYVQFSLRKDSGDSQLPFAKIKKWGQP